MMIGPVQLILVGYKDCRIVEPLKERIRALKDNACVRIVDGLCAYRNHDGTVEVEPIADLLPEGADEPGSIVDRLLANSEASRMTQTSVGTGRGFLFRGDLLPDFRARISRDSGVLALLIEHRWAIPLRDSVTEQGAFPVGDGWMGRDALRDLGLIASDSELEGIHRAG